MDLVVFYFFSSCLKTFINSCKALFCKDSREKPVLAKGATIELFFEQFFLYFTIIENHAFVFFSFNYQNEVKLLSGALEIGFKVKKKKKKKPLNSISTTKTDNVESHDY